MFKFSLILVLFTFVTACSDGGGSNSQPTQVVEKETYNVEDFVLTQTNALKSYGQSSVSLQLNNLATDDAVYVSVTSDQLDNKKLQVTPYKTVLNPNKGQVDLTFDVTDLGSVAAPQIKVAVTTSGNTRIEQTLNMEWQAQ